MVSKPLPNQEIKPTPEESTTGPRLVETTPVAPLPAKQSPAEKVSEWKETVEEKIEDLKESSARALDEARRSASEMYDEAKVKASSAVEQARAKSAELAHQTRVRTRNLIDNYPLHFLAGVAGIAFIAGVLLRVWRSSRYE
jgi:ElaB/YqjD/DUF883 family membrane-anchored ribosome-binding protein